MFNALTQVNPTWLVVGLLVVGNVVLILIGILGRLMGNKWHSEMSALRKAQATMAKEQKHQGESIDGIKLVIAKSYATKDEAKEIARSVYSAEQSNQFDRIMEHFWSRHEGTDLKDQVNALWRKVD